MSHATDATTTGQAEDAARPTTALSLASLLRLSVYWFGLVAVFNGIGIILQERIVTLVDPGIAGTAYGVMNIAGVVIAVLVQPTVGSISDYTITRWGRRKPYIVVGTLLDIVFLLGIASSNTFLSVTAFLVLLQFSSNFAQGPFQGYVPDLVPARQVGLASALVGMMTVLGVVFGIGVATVGTATGDFFWPTLALGIVELATMVSLFLRLDEGRAAKPRRGRSWASIAREAWGTDILHERSFLFLVASRFFVLGGTGLLYGISVRYLERTFGLEGDERGLWLNATTITLAVFTVLATVPSARLSDRVGRKRVIYAACLLGAAGMLVLGLAPEPGVAVVGATLVGVGAGTFLAVDWALMTDIIPKASSGRYMGLSNVATATNGVIAALVGGIIVDLANAAGSPALGPRLALISAVAWFTVGALLLRPVDERRRDGNAPVPGPADDLVRAPTG